MLRNRYLLLDDCATITNRIVRAVQVCSDDNCLGYMGENPMPQIYRDMMAKSLREWRKDWLLYRATFIKDYLKPKNINGTANFFLHRAEVLQEERFACNSIESFQSLQLQHEAALRDFACYY